MPPAPHMAILRPVKTGTRGKVIIEPVAGEVSCAAVAAATVRCANPAILESLAPAAVAGRYSIYAADPVTIFSTQSPGESPFAEFVRTVQCHPSTDEELPLPFCGGWIGFFSYEAVTPVRFVRPWEPYPLPLIRFGFYDHALIFDGEESKWYAVAIESNAVSSTSARQRLGKLHQRVELARTFWASGVPAGPGRLTSQSFTFGQYRDCVNRILDYIAAGDIYQANLSQRFDILNAASPPDVYFNLRKTNPAAFAAYLAWEDNAILSASPELFLQLVGDRVTTRPIKGTRPRFGAADLDATSCSELATSEKEQAELNMIIDLMRNDLGRVCRIGSIEVISAGDIEAHPTVFHRVATISGRLREDQSWNDLLRATFPGGSIVGAPKIRAMQIIRELEPFPRGPYCGAIGWIGLNGDMTLNIAIRTMIGHRGRFQVHAGGAIVAESEPESEYAEIQAKARGMFSSLGIGSQHHIKLTESVEVE